MRWPQGLKRSGMAQRQTPSALPHQRQAISPAPAGEKRGYEWFGDSPSPPLPRERRE